MKEQALVQPLLDTLTETKNSIENQLLSAHPPSYIPSCFSDDYRFALHFIYSYRGSEATFNAYRREIERLLHWAWTVSKKSIKELQREDIENFIYFCQYPPASWIGTKNVSRFLLQNGKRIPNPDWKPFVANVKKADFYRGNKPNIQKFTLSQKALQAIFAILGSFYNFLIQEGYIHHNPVAQIRQKSKFIRKQQNKPIIRRLSELQWSYVIETLEQLAHENPGHYNRPLFILSALYGMYLRISELAATPRWTPQMGDFYMDNDGNWWFKTVGKGNKERDISVSDAMLNCLKRYRVRLGLSPLPSSGETTPLLSKEKGKGAIASTRQIRTIVQSCFNRAMERLRKDGFHEDADLLMSATVHWLRHTGISEDVKHRPREHVRDDAGHSSSAITDRYIDVERRARNLSAKRKIIHPDHP